MRPIPTSPPDTISLTNTIAEIDLNALKFNARLVQEAAPGASILAVVKADAYGHGAIRICRALHEVGVKDFAVATVPEGILLRESGIDDRILTFGAPLPDHIPACAEYDLEITVTSSTVARKVKETASHLGPVKVHILADTGMGRIGMRPEEVPGVLQILENANGVVIEGIWTHFATADEEDETFAHQQLQRFKDLLDIVGNRPVVLHLANSAAIFKLPESHRPFKKVLVRPGISLYGIPIITSNTAMAELRPVMRFKSRITFIKTVRPGESVSYGRKWVAQTHTLVGTVAVGYADGYHRILTNKSEVGIRGHRYRVIGAVTMDMIMVDLGDPDGPGSTIDIGEGVVLFGNGGPSAIEVAAWAETIPYEILCAVSARVPRVYIENRGI